VTYVSRQAIVTKFIGPTNTRPSRVKATCEAGSITVSWDHRYDPENNHDATARALIEKLGWRGEWVSGELPGGGSVYVMVATGSETVIRSTLLKREAV